MLEGKVLFRNNQPVSGISLGKFWAALRNENVVGVISMRVPNDVDFDTYRRKAKECLKLLGKVKVGEMVERNGERYLIHRSNHANRRSKKPRPVKEYLIYNPRNA
ncbi:hypothetical protein [Candidatus Photodesmus blepharus]|uniref:hypothetical protein n=1 Tax=Candidatus Photodesmus blepharonis TaxID=1179155 RepID=UPI000558EA62|nr:hypothetical protein [Candidatus Photodesmus blepharus]